MCLTTNLHAYNSLSELDVPLSPLDHGRIRQTILNILDSFIPFWSVHSLKNLQVPRPRFRIRVSSVLKLQDHSSFCHSLSEQQLKPSQKNHAVSRNITQLPAIMLLDPQSQHLDEHDHFPFQQQDLEPALISAIDDLNALQTFPPLPSLPSSPASHRDSIPSTHHISGNATGNIENLVESFLENFLDEPDSILPQEHTDTEIPHSGLHLQQQQPCHNQQSSPNVQQHCPDSNQVTRHIFLHEVDHSSPNNLSQVTQNRSQILHKDAVKYDDQMHDDIFQNCPILVTAGEHSNGKSQPLNVPCEDNSQHDQQLCSRPSTAAESNVSFVSSSSSDDLSLNTSCLDKFTISDMATENDDANESYFCDAISDILSPESLSEINSCHSPQHLPFPTSETTPYAPDLSIHAWSAAVSTCSPAPSEDFLSTIPPELASNESPHDIQVQDDGNISAEVLNADSPCKTVSRSHYEGALSATQSFSHPIVCNPGPIDKVSPQRRARKFSAPVTDLHLNLSPTITKRLARRETALRSLRRSQFWCHTCSRECTQGPYMLCDNILSPSQPCKRFVCKSCFDEHGWDWNAAQTDPQWACFHCRNTCPAVALCRVAGRLVTDRLVTDKNAFSGAVGLPRGLKKRPRISLRKHAAGS